jgi:plastocyanin
MTQHTPRRTLTSSVAGLGIAALALSGCASGDEGDGTGAPAAERTQSAGTVLDEKTRGGHTLREVPADEAPSVGLEVTEDGHGGWNVHLPTREYTFTPQDAGGDATGGEGHAHLSLDGKKITRVYGEWFYLGADAVPRGEHELTVTLNADDHTTWAVDGAPVSASTTVSGEDGAPDEGSGDHGGHDHGDGGHGSGSGDDGADAGEYAAPADTTVDARVQEGRIVSDTPKRVEVAQGDTVRIVVRSDVADTIHLHGYGAEAPVKPGTPATLTFTADRTGLFEVETHESGLQLFQLLVR